MITESWRTDREDNLATEPVRRESSSVLAAGITIDAEVCREGLDGIEVRWTSNPVERAMGEVAKRCKRDWMVEPGRVECSASARLVKYQDPDRYNQFFNEVLCVNQSTRRFTAPPRVRLLEVKSKRF